MSTCIAVGDEAPLYQSWGPYSVEPAFPLNGVFSGTANWYRDSDSATVRFSLDATATTRLGFEAYRLSNVSEGDVLIYWDEEYCKPDCSYCESPCDDNGVILAAPDLTAPTRPEVALRTILVSTPDTSSLCPDLDVLHIDFAVADDIEPLVNLGVLAYIAPTPAEVAQLVSPTTTFEFPYDAKGTEYMFTVLLGESEGHVREGTTAFTSPDTFCVAFAAFDRAGNLSERSDTTCLDTNDANDPTVMWVEDSIYSSGCCGAADGGGPASALLVALVALVLRGTGRARRRDTF